MCDPVLAVHDDATENADATASAVDAGEGREVTGRVELPIGPCDGDAVLTTVDVGDVVGRD